MSINVQKITDFLNAYCVHQNIEKAQRESHFALSDRKGDLYYVYLLIDPTNESIFYIGKGSGSRSETHLKCGYRERGNENLKKLQRIQSIRESGNEPYIRYLAVNIPESVAFHIEALAIRSLKNLGLTNLHGTGENRSVALWAKMSLSRMKSNALLKHEGRSSEDITLANKIRKELLDISKNGVVEGLVQYSKNGKSFVHEIRRF